VNRAFRYDAGTLTDLGGDDAPDPYAPPASEGYAINDNGDVAGMFVASGSRDAVASYWDSAGGRHPAGIEGTAYGISNGRSLVGLSFGSSWLTQRGQQTMLPGGDVSAWVSINASGHIAYTGRSSTGAADAFLYISGSTRDLGGFTPYGLDGNDEVVGTGAVAGTTTPHAFLYRSGKTIDLNTLISPGSGWTLEVARAINKSGQIVGTGVIAGQRHAFLLTPA
jgi:probable HAF family extracellular repeat protein